MAKYKERNRALSLRKSGKSIREIADTVGVSKSTVSYWCRDIVLSPAQIDALAKHQRQSAIEALLRSAEKKRANRISMEKIQMSLGKEDVGTLSKRDLFIIGLALYWGEGYKKGNDEFGFTNSDPKMITCMMIWLETIYNVDREQLTLRVSINQLHAKRIDAVEKYWSKITGVDRRQFTKPSLIKARSAKVYTDASSHYGTLRIKVRNGSNLRRRVLGSIAALSEIEASKYSAGQ